MTEASEFFLDSNVWIYALSDNNDVKAVKARVLIEGLDNNVFFTSEVVNETCLILKKKSSMTENQIRQLISSFFANYRYVEMSETILLAASVLREKYSFSYMGQSACCSSRLRKRRNSIFRRYAKRICSKQ